MSLQSASPAASSSFSGTQAPEVNDAGSEQAGSFVSDVSQDFADLQGVPANVRVQLSGTGITKIGPSQYQVILSLGGTVTVTPNAADAHQNPTSAVSPASFAWGYVSRNKKVATVNSSGEVTAIARGEVEIIVRGFRDANASFGANAPSQTESVDASLNVIVTA